MKLQKTVGIVSVLSIAVMVGLPFIAAAQPTDLPTPIENYSDVTGLIRTIGGWMLGILLVLAAIFIIVSAYFYLTASGNEETLKKAKQFLIYAIVAVAIGLIAGGLSSLVQNIVGTNVNPQ